MWIAHPTWRVVSHVFLFQCLCFASSHFALLILLIVDRVCLFLFIAYFMYKPPVIGQEEEGEEEVAEQSGKYSNQAFTMSKGDEMTAL